MLGAAERLSAEEWSRRSVVAVAAADAGLAHSVAVVRFDDRACVYDTLVLCDRLGHSSGR